MQASNYFDELYQFSSVLQPLILHQTHHTTIYWKRISEREIVIGRLQNTKLKSYIEEAVPNIICFDTEFQKMTSINEKWLS